MQYHLSRKLPVELINHAFINILTIISNIFEKPTVIATKGM